MQDGVCGVRSCDAIRRQELDMKFMFAPKQIADGCEREEVLALRGDCADAGEFLWGVRGEDLIKMEAVITMVEKGRIALPANIRKRFKTNGFEFRVTKNKIELKPLESIDSIFGALPELDLEIIRREHEGRR